MPIELADLMPSLSDRRPGFKIRSVFTKADPVSINASACADGTDRAGEEHGHEGIVTAIDVTIHFS